MVLPQPSRAWPLFCVLLVLLPLASAQVPTPIADPPRPDLIGGNLVVETQDPHEAKDTVLCGQVYNVGQGESIGSFYVVFHVDNRDEGTVQVVERLAQGHSKRVCVALRIGPGDHQFNINVDSENTIMEKDETNNWGTPRAFRVATIPLPDLAFDHPSGVQPSVSRTGETQSFFATVRNVGRANSTTPTTLIMKDETGELTRLSVPPLAVGQSATVFTRTQPDLRRPGTFHVQYILDPDGKIQEEIETNNHATYQYVVSDHPAPDLTLKRADLNGTFVERRTLRLDVRVINAGDRHSESTVVRLLDGNVSLANRTIGSLSPGQGNDITFHFTLTEGDHVLTVAVDPDDTIVELDESNNRKTFNVTIEAPIASTATANLLVESLDAGPDDPGPNEVVTLTALVRNSGDKEARNVTVGFYVDDELIATSRPTRIAPDLATTISTTWAPPEARTYTLRVQADPDDIVEELDEADNAFARQFTIRDPSIKPAKTDPPPKTDPTPAPTDTSTPPNQPGNTTDPGDGGVVVTTSPVAISDLRVQTSLDGKALTGDVLVTLRNPNLEPLGRMTISFLVDGEVKKEVLIQGLSSAATRGFSSGKLDLPTGEHKITAEVRMVGASAPAAKAERVYTEEAPRGIPGAGVALVALAVAVAAGVVVIRRRAR